MIVNVHFVNCPGYAGGRVRCHSGRESGKGVTALALRSGEKWDAYHCIRGGRSRDPGGARLAASQSRPAPGMSPVPVPGLDDGLDLSNRIASAQKLVDEVDHGRVLTDSDTRDIRDLMREDFVAWNKRFDLLPSAYRKEKERWLVDAKALTPNAWAKQRLEWLKAERDWVLARGD